MIKVNIKEVAMKKGIKTAYQLQKLMNLQPSIAYKWFSNDLKMIGIESLNSLCKALDCEPSDLLVYSSAGKKVEKPVREPRMPKQTTPDSDLLTTKQVAERLGVAERTVRDYIQQEKLPAIKGKQGHNFISIDDVLIFEAVYKSED